tara:strand:+ start:344 stop:883 length:540 start_codon:yes stop_codon:yes gene_type:complete
VVKITEKLKKNIVVTENFPKKGILFQDTFSITKDPELFKSLIKDISKIVKEYKITKVIGIESRGFVFGTAVSFNCNVPFIPIRKPNKLPGKILSQKYKLEYGHDEIQIQHNSIQKKDKLLVIDDLIATGGTALASLKLLKKLNNNKLIFIFVVNLKNLNGVKKLISNKATVITYLDTDG